MSDPRWVTFTADDPRLAITALLGDGQPDLSGGAGGWNEIERRRRTPMTDFNGRPLYKLSIPLMLDGFRTNTPMEWARNILESMASATEDDQPPLIKISGSVPHQELDWVVEDLEWGAHVRDESLSIIRQEVVVKLLEFVDVDQVEISKAGNRGAKCKKHAKHKRYKVKNGDTLRKIAAKELGNGKCWKKIGDLNGMRDPNKKLKASHKPLKMP